MSGYIPDPYDFKERSAPDIYVEADDRETRPAIFGPRGEVLRFHVDRLAPGYRSRNPHRSEQ